MLTEMILCVYFKMEGANTYLLIILFSSTIIISYFFNLLAKRSGVPAVLMLIFLGIIISFGLGFFGVQKPSLLPAVLQILGVVGLILIVLEAALDLHLLKEKIGLIFKSFFAALLGLSATSYVCSLALAFFLNISFLNSLLYSIPISILSSAIILPSLGSLNDYKKEFMIYESTFSDILGIIGFYAVLHAIGDSSNTSVYGEVFGNLILTVVFSILISYSLIYIFQNIRGHNKLFLLISILLLLYAIGKLFHLSSLIIILIFGVILNNHRLFFFGKMKEFLDLEKVSSVLDDFKVVTRESAFVVRTFFFIIFGLSVSLGVLFNLHVLYIGCCLIFIIYLIRAITLVLFSGFNINPQLFLAPRGLITILLFYAIPDKFNPISYFDGILLFVILSSCMIMSYALIKHKKKLDLGVEQADDKGSFVNEDLDVEE